MSYTMDQRFAGQQELGRGNTRPTQKLRIDTSGQTHPADVEFVQETGQNSSMEMDDDDDELDDSEEGEFEDQLSSSPSVPDEDIDFQNVYALHTFLASVDGQASVSKGDTLVLIDDTNSYWWLVRVLKSQSVGYIPAENVETPHERLARLNKHRNVDLTGVTEDDHVTGPGSTAAVAKIVPANRPPRTAKQRNAQRSRGVQFTEPTYYEHSGNDWSEGDESDFTDEDEALHAQGNGFEDETDESDLESPDEEQGDVSMQDDERSPDTDRSSEDVEAGDEDDEYDATRQPRKKVRLQNRPDQELQQPQMAAIRQQQPQISQAPASTPPLRALASNGSSPKSIDQMLREDQQAYQPQLQTQPLRTTASKGTVHIMDPVTNLGHGHPRMASSADFDAAGETRKISLTPKIALDAPAAASDATLVEQSQNEPQRARSISTSSHHSRESHESDNRVGSPVDAPSSPKNRKLQKQPGDSDKKKSGGMFSGLFGRKNKKDKNAPADKEPSGRPGAFSPAPAPSSATGPVQRQWKEHDASLAEQTLRQQQIEAQQVMYQQFGIQRGPNDQTNSFSPRSQSSQNGLSPANVPQRPMRPGSLIGSPGIPGLDVPFLNVLRIFAADTFFSEATFKTVLLSETTSTTELLRQALQRFRIPLENASDFYLTIKELGGSEDVLKETDKPLVAFQKLADAPSTLPSVKRSSVSSLSSISSNLSMHPAIEKLGMKDFSDDSAVKLYLNRYVRSNTASTDSLRPSVTDSEDAPTLRSGDSTPSASTPTPRASMHMSGPVQRFALKVIINAGDLPDGHIFDPYSQAIIPRATLAERRLSAANPALPIPTTPRERILLMPSNVTVSEVLEIALDRFGIVGVVQGGDDVEEKLSKRRSVSRGRYSLLVLNEEGTETLLSPSKKILDAYARPPLFKQQATTKEAKRRSADILAAYTPSPNDIQPFDPIFVLRHAGPATHSPQPSTSFATSPPPHLTQFSRTPDRVSPRPSMSTRSETSDSRYETPSEELPPQLEKQMTTQEMIQAQRAASRAAQHAMVSAHENGDAGVDIVLQDEGTLRSTRDHQLGSRVRYSYIDTKGAEHDISEIMEEEWPKPQLTRRDSSSSITRSISLSTASETGFQSAQTSPKSDTLNLQSSSNSDDEAAIEAVRSAPVSIGASATPLTRKGSDKFQEVLQPNSGGSEDAIDQRISRVLAKIKTKEARSHGGSPLLDPPASDRASPGSRPGSADPGKRSVSGPTHSKQPSVSSLIGSDLSSHSSSHGPSTPATAASGHTTSFTTVSPATRYGSSLSNRVVYPADLGLDTLLAMVGDGQPSPKPVTERLLQPGADELFGPDVPPPAINDTEVQQWYLQMSTQFDSLESRLDDLLSQVVL